MRLRGMGLDVDERAAEGPVLRGRRSKLWRWLANFVAGAAFPASGCMFDTHSQCISEEITLARTGINSETSQYNV